MSTSDPRLLTLRYAVARAHDDWALGDETMPEARAHRLGATRVEQQLEGWRERSGRDVQVGCNLAVRWDEEHPSFGVDPDVYVVEPPPPEGDDVRSLLLWKPGHFAPLIALEIVSSTHPHKDYVVAPEKYAASGTKELWVFDPELAGPHMHGGPFRLQLWCRDEAGDFTRVYAGPGPVRSPVLDAWLFAVDEGRSLRIADDEEGTRWWATPHEVDRAAKDAERAAKVEALAARDIERAAKDAALAARDTERAAKDAERAAKDAALAARDTERAAKDAERAAKDAALAQVAALEAELARRGS